MKLAKGCCDLLWRAGEVDNIIGSDLIITGGDDNVAFVFDRADEDFDSSITWQIGLYSTA